MKKIIISVLLFFTYFIGSSQKIIPSAPSSTPSGSGFTISYSIIPQAAASQWLIQSPLGTTAAKGEAANAVFIEFGDGTFSFLPQGTHEYYSAVTNRSPITKITGVYGGGGRPPKHRIEDKSVFNSSFGIPTGSSGTGLSPYKSMGILHHAGEKLQVTPNIGSVVGGDTMIFVVTYKLGFVETNRSLLFLFNDNESINAFESVTVGQSMRDLETGATAKFVRTYTGENEQATMSGNVNTAKESEPKYVSAISVEGLIADTIEHNIFITLIPKANLLSTDLNQTAIKAIIVPPIGRKGEKVRYDTASIVLPILDRSHDPNYIKVNPPCLLLPKDNKEVKYHLHFQNTGCGQASKVKVVIDFPTGLDLTSNFIFDRATGTKVDNGDLITSNPIVAGDSIIFEFIKKPSLGFTLDGLGHSPTCFCNEKTMGDIWFTVKLNNSSPDIFHAQAHIVFYNSPDESANDPIYTNTAYSQFRSCCDCEQKCDPCKKRKGLWKWLFCKKC